MWLFSGNAGFNVKNYYKLELQKNSKGDWVFNIYDIAGMESVELEKSVKVHPDEVANFKDDLCGILNERFLIIDNTDKTVWLNKDMVKMLEVKADDKNSVVIRVKSIAGFVENYTVAESYPEFSLFWIKNFKNNVYDDITMTIPTPEMHNNNERNKKIEKVINI